MWREVIDVTSGQRSNRCDKWTEVIDVTSGQRSNRRDKWTEKQ
jgi:hypothetical protein